MERNPKCPLLSPGGVKFKMRGIVGRNSLIKDRMGAEVRFCCKLDGELTQAKVDG